MELWLAALLLAVLLLLLFAGHNKDTYAVYETRSLVPYDGAPAQNSGGSYPWGLTNYPWTPC